jgi:hypothetical protein
MNRNFLIIGGIIIVIAAIIFLLPLLKNRPVSEQVEETVNPNIVVQVLPSKLPENFPSAVPIDQGVNILTNYNATTPEGVEQATRSFKTDKTVKTNFDFYKNYLSQKSNGWTITGEVSDESNPNHKAIFAENSIGSLNINISAGPESGTSVVDISFTIINK